MHTSIENSLRGMHYESLKLTAVVIQAKVEIKTEHFLMKKCFSYMDKLNSADRRGQLSPLLKVVYGITQVFALFLIVCTVPFVGATSLIRYSLTYLVVIVDKLAHLTSPTLSLLIEKIQKALSFLKTKKLPPKVEEPVNSSLDDCPICMDTITLESVAERPDCPPACQKTQMHAFCFQKWIKERNICPLCNTPNTTSPKEEVTLAGRISKVALVNSFGYGHYSIPATDLDSLIARNRAIISINPTALISSLQSGGIQTQTRDILGINVISIKEPGATNYRNICINEFDNKVIFSDFDLIGMINSETVKRNEQYERVRHEEWLNRMRQRRNINIQPNENPREQPRISTTKILIALACSVLVVGLFKAIQKYNKYPITG